MYRIVVVDDEPVVREGIASTIDWGAHGYTLAAVCRDGREAITALAAHTPDVVITDICMPFVDGLEVAAWIAEHYPRVKTIVLTGYDQFEYAQEALRLKVREFVLKPITAAELRGVLETVRVELDAERDAHARFERLRQQVAESLPVLRERFLNRIVQSRLSPEEIAQKSALLDIHLSGPYFTVVVCDLDYRERPVDPLELAVYGVVAACAEEGITVFATPRDESVAIIRGESAAAATQRALAFAEAVARRIRRELHRSVTIGVGEAVDGIQAAVESYREACTALEYRLLSGANQIITIAQVRGEDDAPAPRVGVPYDRFLAAMRSGDEVAARRAMGELFDALQRHRVPVERGLVTVERLLAAALDLLERLGVDYAGVAGTSAGLPINPFRELASCKTRAEMEAWLMALFVDARAVLSARRERHSCRRAADAVALIEREYADPDLSLTRICRALAVSKSFLSPVFKAYTGKTFVEFLTATRIGRAQELIAQARYRSYEIAERVGFRDAHYFSVAFRKHTGVTPTAFREALQRSAP